MYLEMTFMMSKLLFVIML